MAGKNKNPNARYAFIGLILAALSCVSTGLLGTAKGMLALQMFPLGDDVLNIINGIFVASLALLIIGLSLYALLDPNAISRIFTARRLRYGANTFVMSIAFLGILFAVNYLAFNNPKSWDWTEDQANTLAPETIQTLASLPQKVKATAFYTSTYPKTSAEELLNRFKENSKGKFEYEFVDPNRDPLAARQAGVTGDGKILLVMGEAKEVASYAEEAELTKAMIRLVSPEKRVVYFLQGHGEPSIDPGGEIGYATVKETLESKNYVVNTLNLLTTKDIPADASVIIIAGPRKPVSNDEVARLKSYVDAGGALFVMEDPTPLTDFGSQPDPLNEYLKKDWGIELNNDVVIDYVNTQNPLFAVAYQFGAHPIMSGITSDYVVILPQARSLTLTSGQENVTQTALMFTTEQSWGETELSATEAVKFDEGKDLAGPLTLAAAGENFATNGRVVVFGNSIFASDNGGFDLYGNGDAFINSVDWAAEQENLINLTVRDRTFRTFTPPSTLWFMVVLIFAIVVLPGLVVITGVTTWVSRRRKG